MGTTISNRIVQPYLCFNGKCEQAIEFYRKAPGAEVDLMMRFKESPEPHPPDMLTPGIGGHHRPRQMLKAGTESQAASTKQCGHDIEQRVVLGRPAGQIQRGHSPAARQLPDQLAVDPLGSLRNHVLKLSNMTSQVRDRHPTRTGARLRSVWICLLAAALVCSMLLKAGAQAASGTTKSLSKFPFESEILAFEASDRTNPPPRGAILFIGSSSIRLWKTLARDFPMHKVINRGFGGSQIIDSVNYAERIVLPYQPRQIVLYAGGNDINGGKDAEQVFADYKRFVAKVHFALPMTKVTYISIAPNPARWVQVEKVKAANRLISEHTKLDPRLGFVDVFAEMLGRDGKPKPDIYVEDRLHMNARGYELWTGIVGKYLD